VTETTRFPLTARQLRTEFHSVEAYLKLARSNFNDHTGGSKYCARLTGPFIDGYVYTASEICYNYLDIYHDQKYSHVAVGMYIPPDDPRKKAFQDWILSPKVSPWRKAFKKPIEIIKDSRGSHARGGIHRGILLHPENLEGFPWKANTRCNVVLMNFLIATRMVNSFPAHVDFWHECVQMGTSPEDAFFLARNFNFIGKTFNRTIIHDRGSFAFGGQINMERFKDGEFRSKTQKRGNVWLDKDIVYGEWGDNNNVYFCLEDFKFLPETKTTFTKDEFKSLVLSHEIANRVKAA
jgi:hypothetical protein